MNPTTAPAAAETGPKIFTIGTLRYTQRGIVMLFFWLMWNDFCMTLFENVQSFTNILYKNNGASYLIISLSGSLVGILVLIINPALSTYSDRYRGKYGRRRPFLMAATLPLSLVTIAIPYMPELGKYLTRYPALTAFWNHLGITGPVFCIGIGIMIFNCFNLVISSLFSYYWWDVVPEEVLGRFQGLNLIVGRISAFVFNFFLFGLGETHLKPLCFGLALFFLVFYLLSTWKVKEGEYPPPEPRKGGDGTWVAIKTYLTECYTQPRYLWVFGALTMYGLGSLGNAYQFYYVHYDLGISLDVLGKFTALPMILLFLLGYGMGSLTDKFKPIRLMGPCLLILATATLISYYCVHDKWSFLICNGLVQLPIFALSICIGALVVEVYPREKLGQFCSAASIMGVVIGSLLNPPLGLLFDHLQNNRMGYLFSASFQVAAAFCFFRLYHIWKRLHPDQLLPGESPEPV